VINVDLIPQEMKAAKRWVTWHTGTRNGKTTKIPYVAGTRTKASSTDPTTWRTFGEALRAHRAGHSDGIGFVLGDGWAGVDLDHCREDGEIATWAHELIALVDSYTELSPSGMGVHIIARGSLPPGRRRTGTKEPHGIEMYDGERYFTVTGQVVDNRETVQERTAELGALHVRVFGEPAPERTRRPQPAPVVNLDDREIVDRASKAKNGGKFTALWSGDISGYPSPSEADIALCNILAFWTRDPAQIDRLFRSSGLYRDKWDREDYSTGTIDKALAGVTDFWQPGAAHQPGTTTFG